jgi:hypothetical protein
LVEVVGGADRAYVKAVTLVAGPMAQTASPPLMLRPMVFLAAGVGLLLAGTVVLWAHYGTAVFFEIIRTGFAACF